MRFALGHASHRNEVPSPDPANANTAAHGAPSGHDSRKACQASLFGESAKKMRNGSARPWRFLLVRPTLATHPARSLILVVLIAAFLALRLLLHESQGIAAFSRLVVFDGRPILLLEAALSEGRTVSGRRIGEIAPFGLIARTDLVFRLGVLRGELLALRADDAVGNEAVLVLTVGVIGGPGGPAGWIGAFDDFPVSIVQIERRVSSPPLSPPWRRTTGWALSAFSLSFAATSGSVGQSGLRSATCCAGAGRSKFFGTTSGARS